MNSTLADQIDALLPQTQCRKCGFEGCRPYAEAIAEHRADINQCPPGGAIGIEKLAGLLNVAAKPLSAEFGVEHPRLVAQINEAECIGCTKCIPPCPVDAILGASKHMHTVITTECTGCELCIAPCPVNCISMHPAPYATWTNEDATRSRARYQAKTLRLKKIGNRKSRTTATAKRIAGKG